MAITINVNGVTSGGGTQGSSAPQSAGYSRPDFSNYTAVDKSQPKDILPSSDRLAGDIVNEMQQRGISFVPGTANYDNVLDTLKGQQRESLLGSVDKRYNDRMSDIDVRRDSLMAEIQSRIEESRKAELEATSDPDEIKKINEKYDKLFDAEEKDASSFFQKEYDAEEKRHKDELVEIEKRLADAVEKLVNNTQGQSQQGTATPQPTPQGTQGNAQGGSQGTTQAQGGGTAQSAAQTQRGNAFDNLLDDLDNAHGVSPDALNQQNAGTATPQPTPQGTQGNAQGGSQGTTQAQGGVGAPVQPSTQHANDGNGQGSQGSQSQTQQGQGAGGNGSQGQGQNQNQGQQGSQQQNTGQQTQGQNGGQNTPPPPNNPPFIPYSRPDFEQYKPNASTPGGAVMPTTDRLVGDIRAEITRRGVMLIPGTQNFNTMMNTLQQQQRSNLMGQIDNQRDARLQDIDKRADSLMDEIKTRVDISRASELAGSDPLLSKSINDRWDKKLERERTAAGAMFEREEAAVNAETDQQRAEAEQNLTEAIQRLTEELSQGNKDSYLNQLRDKYKEQIWMRDNAATEDEVREHSREAAKIQERMQRAMSGSALSPFALRGAGAAASALMMGAHGLSTYLRQSDDMAWNLGIEQAGSVLSGNAFNAIRQRNAREIAMNEGIGQTVGGVVGGGLGFLGGAYLGGQIGAAGGPWGAIAGAVLGAIGGALGAWGGQQVAYYGWNRPKLRENAQVNAADLWRQEEQRMLQFNDLAMLTRGNVTNVDAVRNWYMMGATRDYLSNSQNQNTVNTEVPGAVQGKWSTAPTTNAFDEYSDFNLYDLGYTAPEFAQKAAQRIKQRGFADHLSVNRALYSEALERIFSMNSGTLGQLSGYDRFWRKETIDGKRMLVRNDANQDFSNLAVTLAEMGTTGMQQGAWARSDEFAGYMSQLQGSQRSTFLTVDNARAGRQVATGQKMFGDKFGAEAMQGIQAVNNQVQNPGGGFAKTLLYDVIQELYPETRGDLRKIKMAQYNHEKQNRIQKEYAKRIASIYGGPDTTTGFLAFQDIYGIQNPNILNPIAKQMVSGGGLEAVNLKKADQDELVSPISKGGYTPDVTKKLNVEADSQMRDMLKYSEAMVNISARLLRVIQEDTNKTLKEAVENLKK